MTLTETLVPLFLLIGLGFAAVRLRWLAPEGVAPAGQIVVRLALPALIFLAVAAAPPAEVLQPGLLVAYAAGSLAAFGLALAAARLALGLDPGAAAVVGLGSALANSGFMGFPVAQALMGPETAGRLLAHCMIVENILVIPLGLVLMARAGAAGGGGVWAGVLRNPLLVALAAGLAVSAAGLTLPGPLRAALDLLARLSAPLALLVIGGMLASLPAQGRPGAVALLVAGKLGLHPLAVWAGLAVVPGAGGGLAAGAVLFAAMPMVTIFPLLAARAGQGQMAATGLIAATLASFASLPVAARLLGLS